ncbi:MAG: histidinol dehydrogenase, partial [Pseudomonadales bacterium]
HLEIHTKDAVKDAELMYHFGASFIGSMAAEVLGDYGAGPNHTLPTGGTARFASALGVYDFQVRQSLIECKASGVRAIAGAAATLAEQEGLFAHAQSARKRLELD